VRRSPPWKGRQVQSTLAAPGTGPWKPVPRSSRYPTGLPPRR
jgi:hypothetical protein